MNEKEAREILKLRQYHMMDGINHPNEEMVAYAADKYLEALEKAKGLEWVIRKYLHYHDANADKCHSCFIGMRRALKEWEKIK